MGRRRRVVVVVVVVALAWLALPLLLRGRARGAPRALPSGQKHASLGGKQNGMRRHPGRSLLPGPAYETERVCHIFVVEERGGRELVSLTTECVF